MDQGFSDGCYTYIMDTNEPDPERPSFAHPDFDPVWATFADRDTPAAVHVAANGDYEAVSPSFKNNGKDELELGGDAPARRTRPVYDWQQRAVIPRIDDLRRSFRSPSKSTRHFDGTRCNLATVVDELSRLHGQNVRAQATVRRSTVRNSTKAY